MQWDTLNTFNNDSGPDPMQYRNQALELLTDQG
nr:hypothetical protein [Corynebacterium sp. HMSC14B06]